MNYTNNQKVKDFWENCPEHFSHTKKNYNQLVIHWREAFLTLFNFDQKIILDYGIGAAYFGYYLLKNCNIKYYYGLDIAERSLIKAKNLLTKNNFTNFSLHNITENIQFKNVDIVVCQQVIQHFPDKETLDNFLHFIATINPKKIMLQFQLCVDKNNEYEFNNSEYKTIQDVVRSCRVSEHYVLTKLNQYNPIHKNILNTPFGKTSCFIVMAKDV
jgi:2-polyprenyl-3-methyl-5-hydroxy-6-metoxy-1,4-benzoquinol methylase